MGAHGMSYSEFLSRKKRVWTGVSGGIDASLSYARLANHNLREAEKAKTQGTLFAEPATA
jgi:NH3-dependent NAD+ synthetase